MSNDRTPCAGCKFLRQKCTEDCAFAPYFPLDQMSKFEKVHKVFGASNVSKIIKKHKVKERQKAVASLAYEAEQLLRDPIYGCLGHISLIEQQLSYLQHEFFMVKSKLTQSIGPNAMPPILPEAYMGWSSRPNSLYRPRPALGGSLVIRQPQQHLSHQQQQQFLEAQQMAMAREQYQQQLVRAQQQQYQQQLVQAQQKQVQLHDFFRLDSGFEGSGSVSGTATGFNQIGSSQQPYYQTKPDQQHEQQQLQKKVLFRPQQQPQHGNDFLNLRMQPGEECNQQEQKQQQPQTKLLLQPQQTQHGNDFLNLRMQPGEQVIQEQQQQQPQTPVLFQPQQPQHENDFLNLQKQPGEELTQQEQQQELQTQVLFDNPQQPDERVG